MEYKLINKKDGLYVDVNGKGKLMKVIRAWEAVNGWYNFALKVSDVIPASDSITGKEETVYFGLVQGFEEELGDFALCELEECIKKGLVWELKGGDLLNAGRRH